MSPAVRPRRGRVSVGEFPSRPTTLPVTLALYQLRTPSVVPSSGATGAFRAAIDMAAAPQRGANPHLRRRARGWGGSDLNRSKRRAAHLNRSSPCPPWGSDLYMHPRAMSFSFDKHFVHIRVLSQNVKDHFCIVEVVAMNVGSLALQVSGIDYAPNTGV